jgi:exodeoxyribonuclease VII small subunit
MAAMEKKKEKFEDHLRRVEDAVKTLESGQLGLEASLEKYETGMAALKHCYSILEQAEKKIQLLVKEKDGSLSEEEFKPEKKAAKKKKAPDGEIPF